MAGDWTVPTLYRRGTPRARREVRAKVAHTDHQKRRVEVFVTEPILRELRWRAGGHVSAAFKSEPSALMLRLTPAHKGLRATAQNAGSRTVRICVAGAPIGTGLCAPVRSVPFAIAEGRLTVWLPVEWAARRLAETEPAKITEAA